VGAAPTGLPVKAAFCGRCAPCRGPGAIRTLPFWYRESNIRHWAGPQGSQQAPARPAAQPARRARSLGVGEELGVGTPAWVQALVHTSMHELCRFGGYSKGLGLGCLSASGEGEAGSCGITARPRSWARTHHSSSRHIWTPISKPPWGPDRTTSPEAYPPSLSGVGP
jgi:hypothetical protein